MQGPARGGSCCAECAEGGAAKYRCPRCRARYCSVACCKKHKEQCDSRIEPAQRPASTESSWGVWKQPSPDDEGTSWTVDDILTEEDEGDKVPLQKLQLLRESEELRGILLNPHLQQLLLAVDQAEDKSSHMKKCMQEPLFVEFADCCLRVIEPPEQEMELAG